MEQLNSDIYRLLDANMNRALEGIRVIEETARMLFDDFSITKKIKDTRHSLVQIIKEEKNLNTLMLFGRDSEKDVLRNGKTITEKSRSDVISIVRANSSRSQEAVRTLEEYIKLSFPVLSEKFKKIRFKLYDIEKAIVSRIHLSGMVSECRLALYVVIDREQSGEKDIYEITRASVDSGAGTVSYCDKISSDYDFMKNAELMLSACEDQEVTTIIDNRLDIAMIVHADGVRLEQGDIPVKQCRKIAGQNFVIVSLIYFDNNLSEKDIVVEEADYYIIGPAFNNTINEQDNEKKLREFVSRSSIPVLAFGGITINNIKSVFDCGVSGITLTPNFANSENINIELQKYKKIIETYRANVPTY